MLRWSLGIPLCFLLALAAACHSAAPPSARLQMRLSTQPAVPAVGRDTTFSLLLRDAQGRPVSGASVRLSLAMTFMNMGQTVVQMSDRGHGLYTGVGAFSMGGDWDCRAIVEVGGVRAEQVFHYKVG
ncbi:MAG TPA: FixH family protein [Terriglobales bacterium]|nr:FixH family protein [Terriglobales bacterium]